MFRLGRLLRTASGPAMTPRAALRILALSPSADLSHGAIKKAYVKQTLLCHPDLHPSDPTATEKFRNLADALRVALKALEVRQGLSRAGGNSRGATGDGAADESDGLYDSQSALEALRRAVLAYRVHRESALGAAARGAKDASGPVGQAKSTVNEDKDGDDDEDEDRAFFSPSLEYVSAVCRKEALAMRRVRVFCDELPAVLCGSSTAALFESVAFFHARYVQATADCVLRFSKDLPLIVRRVVKHRKRFIKNSHTKATTGFGTGNRPRVQRIEDMAMKPLVLVGALIFDLPEKPSPAGARQKHASGEPAASTRDASATRGQRSGEEEDDDGSVTSTCGVSRPSDITVSDELKCTIYPADSIGTITDKLSRWEAASYDRLKLELAIVDACVFASSMLKLSDGDGGDGNALAVVPHLHIGRQSTERVLLTLQSLSAQLCDDFDDSLDHAQQQRKDGVTLAAAGSGGEGGDRPTRSIDEKMDDILMCLGQHATADRQRDYAAMEARSAEDDRHAAEGVSVPVLIAECRRLATLAAPGLKGSVNISWSEESDLVEAPKDVVRADGTKTQGGVASEEGETREQREQRQGSGKPGFTVGRHAECCAAEMIAFAVSLDLCKDLRAFLLRLRQALKTVVMEYHKAHALLPELTRIRDATVKEEFILERSDGISPANEDAEGEENRKYRYRGPIYNFVRLRNMVTSRELLFWQLLHRHREYLAQHASAMSMMNVYLDCLPGMPHSNPSGGGSDSEGNRNVLSGWIGESVDEGGTWDTVVLTTSELEDPANLAAESAAGGAGGGGAFRQWLEDVVEQSSLNKECRTILEEAGIGYVRRDPALPLTNYLSFVKVFVLATAVRSVLEGRPVPREPSASAASSSATVDAADGEPHHPRLVGSEEVGVTLIVGHRCDVRDGGRLLVPWSMDPNVLIALLTDGAVTTPKLEA